MATTRLDIISIGTLARNRLWNETETVRTPHTTTTLIRTGKRTILVDPGLPGQALGARLHERTGLRPDAVDTVFLTSLGHDHRAGLSIFPKARHLVHEIERDAEIRRLTALLEEAPEADDDAAALRADLALVKSLRPADDKLADQIDLFPLFGYTPGNCGVLVSTPLTSTLITGKAVPTLEHFLAGQALPECFDIKAAQEAMAEVYEIADLVVPGHDNLFVNPRGQGV